MVWCTPCARSTLSAANIPSGVPTSALRTSYTMGWKAQSARCADRSGVEVAVRSGVKVADRSGVGVSALGLARCPGTADRSAVCSTALGGAAFQTGLSVCLTDYRQVRVGEDMVLQQTPTSHEEGYWMQCHRFVLRLG